MLECRKMLDYISLESQDTDHCRASTGLSMTSG